MSNFPQKSCPCPCRFGLYDIFDKMYLFNETPSSADFITGFLCTSDGIRKVKFPLIFFNPNGSGIGSRSSFSYFTVSVTTFYFNLANSPWDARDCSGNPAGSARR
jgi:hypothetical protein